MTEQIDRTEWERMRKDRAVRQAISSQSFYWFFHLYLGLYIEYATADFQREMMELASQESLEHLVIMAFRGSGKSTIITTTFPLWAIMGALQKKYVVIVSQTQNQAQQHLKNIALELANNDLISKDFMPYEQEENELGVSAINLPKFNARIIAVSREQGVRGLRFGSHRPDLVIADDVEDSNSVKTKEGRAKTFEWFTGELLPLGSENTKFVTVGNLLHEDSLLMRLRDGINNGKRNGRFLEYPLVVNGTSLWSSRFPDQAAIDRMEHRIGNPITWQREYMLHLVPDDEQLVTRKMIQYYEQLPPKLAGQHRRYVIGVDLAISENDKADCTAMVTLDVRGYGDNVQIYVLRHPVNQHIGFRKTIDTIKELDSAFSRPDIFIESTAYQEASIGQLKHEGFDVHGIKPKADKRSRLSLVADKIERGVVVFPIDGCEDLITQLVGFGIEKHDDLVDAFTMAVLEVIRTENRAGMVRIERSNFWSRYDPMRSRNNWD